jgi:Protein of unknown function (DUF2384)
MTDSPPPEKAPKPFPSPKQPLQDWMVKAANDIDFEMGLPRSDLAIEATAKIIALQYEAAMISGARGRIYSAARVKHAKATELIDLLFQLDAEVADQALETFDGDAEGAAVWLLSGEHRGLPQRTPVELSQTVGGKAQVLNVLRAIDAGGYL